MTTSDMQIELGPLKIKLLRPADAEDWIVVRVDCKGNYGISWVEGDIMMASQIEHWQQQVKSMNKTLGGDATLESMEPGLKLSMQMDKLGHIKARVEVTGLAGGEYEIHAVPFEIDQSHLPALIRQTELFSRACRG